MFLPIGDDPNPRKAQPVNLALLALNAAVFIFITWPMSWQSADPADPQVREYLLVMAEQLRVPARALIEHTSVADVFLFHYGFRPASPHLFALFSSIFLHAGWLHMLGNGLFLWIFGDNVEHNLGSVRYAAVYLLTGVAATLFFALFQLDSQVPLVGASGAISGVLGCYFLWFPRNRVRVLMVLFVFVQVISVPARWVLGFYVIVENLLPFVLGSAGSVAYGAHLGGFIGGIGCAMLVDRWRGMPRVEGRRTRTGARASPREEEPVAAGGPASGFSEAIAAGRMEQALASYARMPAVKQRRLAPDELFGLADWLTQQHRYDTALAVLQRFVATHPVDSALARAHLRAGLIQLHAMERAPAAYQHLLAVLDLDPEPEVERTAREALGEIEKRMRSGRRFH